MYKKFRNYLDIRPKTRVMLGCIFVVLGILAAILPLIPGAFLAIIGLEILGIRLIFLENMMDKFNKNRVKSNKTSI